MAHAEQQQVSNRDGNLGHDFVNVNVKKHEHLFTLMSNVAQARQTALSPREVTTTTQEPTENSIKQEPLPSPPGENI